MFKKLLVEFIGTFFLILTVGCTVFSNGSGVIPAIAIGFILMAMVSQERLRAHLTMYVRPI